MVISKTQILCDPDILMLNKHISLNAEHLSAPGKRKATLLTIHILTDVDATMAHVMCQGGDRSVYGLYRYFYSRIAFRSAREEVT